MNGFFEDYRNYLSEAHEARQLRNPAYSMRAFARDLGIGTSTLTEVLSGKYGLSKARALQVGERLGLSDNETQHFSDLMTAKFHRDQLKRADAARRVKDRMRVSSETLSLDSFKVISDWYHLAILELTSLGDFDATPTWIAARLGISAKLAADATERLIRLGLLEQTEGTYRASMEESSIGNGMPASAVRKFHRQVLERAIRALDLQTTEERENSSTIFSFRRSDLPKAKSELRQFRRQFAKKFSQEKNAEDVVCLSIQLFSLIEKEKR